MTSTPTLSTLERSAIAIALQDAHRCGCAASPSDDRRSLLARIATGFFGRRRPNGLADPKLETVRQFVCWTARRRRPADEITPALRAHGFSTEQIDAMTLLSA